MTTTIPSLISLTAQVVNDMEAKLAPSSNTKRSPNNPDDRLSRIARQYPGKVVPTNRKKSYHSSFAYNEYLHYEYAD